MNKIRHALVRTGTGVVVACAMLTACPDSPTSPKDATTTDDSHAFYVGTENSSFYLMSMDCNRGFLVTGKLFVVLKKDASGAVLDCEIGMSGVTQTQLSIPPGDMRPYQEPTLAATSIDYHERLGLTGNVALLSSWSNPYDHFKSAVTNGTNSLGQPTFSFRQGNSPGIGYNESWAFAHNSGYISGYVTNTDRTYCLGRDSDASGEMPLKAVVKK